MKWDRIASFFSATAVLLCFCPSLQGLDINLHFTPQIIIPINEDDHDEDLILYTTGGGISAAVELETPLGLSPLAELGVSFIPVNRINEVMSLLNVGTGLSFTYDPLARLRLRLAGTGGIYNASAFELSRRNLFWNVNFVTGYRFSPTFSILAGIGYSQYYDDLNDMEASFLKGMSVSLVTSIGIGSASARSTGINIEVQQAEPVFPIRYYTYSKEPIGVIRINNREASEIRDVEVHFECEGYTSASFLCGSVARINKQSSVELPLYAAFSERVLDFTESTKAQGKVLVTYKLLNTRIDHSFSTVLSFHHRNASTWEDPRWTAAFASPNDAVVLDLSKFYAGLIRDHLRPDIDQAFQFGMGIFESLRLMGLSYSFDPAAVYSQFRQNTELIDYIQYPYQTFAYKGGDSDDLSLVYIVALASIGMDTALVALPDKAYAAFALDSTEEAARRFFSDPSLFIWRDGKPWVIVDTSKLREGFVAAWYSGAAAWNGSEKNTAEEYFIPMTKTWSDFKPIGVSSEEASPSRPVEKEVSQAFEDAMSRFVAIELEPKLDRIRSQFARTGATARQLNSLGILYAQYGEFEEAKEAFTEAVLKGSEPAIINLANTAYLLKAYEEAAYYYQEVLKRDPENQAAKTGLAKSQYELDSYSEVRDLISSINSGAYENMKHSAYRALS